MPVKITEFICIYFVMSVQTVLVTLILSQLTINTEIYFSAKETNSFCVKNGKQSTFNFLFNVEYMYHLILCNGKKTIICFLSETTNKTTYLTK